MCSAWRVILGLSILLVGSALPTLGTLSVAAAADKALSDAQIKKMESGTEGFVNDLIAAGVWTKDCDEYKQFNKYESKAKLNIPKFDTKAKKYVEGDTAPITGAEYRRALASVRAYANANKLGNEGKKRVNMEFFGQETRPERGTDKYNAGIDRIKNLLYMIAGEAVIAGAPADKSTSKK